MCIFIPYGDMIRVFDLEMQIISSYQNGDKKIEQKPIKKHAILAQKQGDAYYFFRQPLDKYYFAIWKRLEHSSKLIMGFIGLSQLRQNLRTKTEQIPAIKHHIHQT